MRDHEREHIVQLFSATKCRGFPSTVGDNSSGVLSRFSQLRYYPFGNPSILPPERQTGSEEKTEEGALGLHIVCNPPDTDEIRTTTFFPSM